MDSRVAQQHPRPLVPTSAFADDQAKPPHPCQGNNPLSSSMNHRTPSLGSIWRLLEITKPAIIEALEEWVFRHLNIALQCDHLVNPTAEEYTQMARQLATWQGERYVKKRQSRCSETPLTAQTPATLARHEHSSSCLATQALTVVLSADSSLPVPRSAYVQLKYSGPFIPISSQSLVRFALPPKPDYMPSVALADGVGGMAKPWPPNPPTCWVGNITWTNKMDVDMNILTQSGPVHTPHLWWRSI
jgi:hypothetical protein